MRSNKNRLVNCHSNITLVLTTAIILLFSSGCSMVKKLSGNDEQKLELEWHWAKVETKKSWPFYFRNEAPTFVRDERSGLHFYKLKIMPYQSSRIFRQALKDGYGFKNIHTANNYFNHNNVLILHHNEARQSYSGGTKGRKATVTLKLSGRFLGHDCGMNKKVVGRTHKDEYISGLDDSVSLAYSRAIQTFINECISQGGFTQEKLERIEQIYQKVNKGLSLTKDELNFASQHNLLWENFHYRAGNKFVEDIGKLSSLFGLKKGDEVLGVENNSLHFNRGGLKASFNTFSGQVSLNDGSFERGKRNLYGLSGEGVRYSSVTGYEKGMFVKDSLVKGDKILIDGSLISGEFKDGEPHGEVHIVTGKGKALTKYFSDGNDVTEQVIKQNLDVEFDDYQYLESNNQRNKLNKSLKIDALEKKQQHLSTQLESILDNLNDLRSHYNRHCKTTSVTLISLTNNYCHSNGWKKKGYSSWSQCNELRLRKKAERERKEAAESARFEKEYNQWKKEHGIQELCSEVDNIYILEPGGAKRSVNINNISSEREYLRKYPNRIDVSSASNLAKKFEKWLTTSFEFERRKAALDISYENAIMKRNKLEAAEKRKLEEKSHREKERALAKEKERLQVEALKKLNERISSCKADIHVCGCPELLEKQGVAVSSLHKDRKTCK